MTSAPQRFHAILDQLDLQPDAFHGGDLEVRSPIDGEVFAAISTDTEATAQAKIAKATDAFAAWRGRPAPQRGELVRLLGEELRRAKEPLGRLVSLEAGKILSEGLGEVQEMIDICDFAVGLSRQLYGLTIASERPGHALRETWHPLGPVGVISAFNFPVAVWSWNAALAFVCGDPVVWKPSEKTPITALACQAIMARAMRRFGDAPDGLSDVLVGGPDVGQTLTDDPRVPLVSATGSIAMGKKVAPRVAARLGRTILELGGNNALIVTETADLALAKRAIAFAAAGTAGQRCTSLRRLFVHASIYDRLVPELRRILPELPSGDPYEDGVLVGPLIDQAAFEAMERALAAARDAGGAVHGGGAAEGPAGGVYARPALVEMPEQTGPMLEETFAPILYVVRYEEFDQAIAMQNAVPQGLSSAVFTRDVLEGERFLGPEGSDCGIANVNIGTSGAEIGGAFGGEKETGGGREAGSDAWQAYMRRQTNTINWGKALPLALGIDFSV